MNVYKYTYSYSYHERVAVGMDTELTGRILTQQNSYLILAPSQSFADLYFQEKHDHLADFKLINVDDLGHLDAEIRTCYGTALG